MCRLHRRLEAASEVFRLDDNLLQMIWEQVEQRCVVPPVEEEMETEEDEDKGDEGDDMDEWDEDEQD